MNKKLIELSESLLEYLLQFKQLNPDFTFSLRQRDSAQANEIKRLEAGQWFQGSFYIYVPLFKKGDSARKIKTIGFVISFSEDEISNYIEISFKKGDFENKDIEFHTKLAEKIGLQLNKFNHGKWHFDDQRNIYKNLDFYIGDFRNWAITLLKDKEITENYIIPEEQFQKALQKINSIRNKIQPEMSSVSDELINLLKYKKQIILQGPPGTGKTKKAKEIAHELTQTPPQLLQSIYSQFLKDGNQLTTKEGHPFTITQVLPAENRLVVLVPSGGKSYPINFNEIENCIIGEAWLHPVSAWNKSGNGSYSVMIAKFVMEEWAKLRSEKEGQVRIIQFHPSYTYEDFVRGIVAKPNEDSEGILYVAENKTIGRFAQKALENYLPSKGILSKSSKFQEKLNVLLDIIREKIEQGETYSFGDKSTAEIIAIKEDGILYNFPNRQDIKYKILFSDLERVFSVKEKIQKATDLRDLEAELSLKMKGKYPYYYMLLRQLEKLEADGKDEIAENLKNFVLIIDEINRANLSAVLGELIYALEYRDESVESMYEVDGNKKLQLPPNLYIIGTMNTADRSVGHIDYAIRRRFAFVDVPPKRLEDDDKIYFNTNGFDTVSALFNSDNVSKEFEIDDVRIGHSYFIAEKKEATSPEKRDEIFTLKMKYEVVPILNEYVKDGVLVGKFNDKEIKEYIKTLVPHENSTI